MNEELTTWPRPHHQPGGGDAMVFYAVYGKFEESLSVSRTKYKCDGIPAGVATSKFRPGAKDGVFASFLEEPYGDLLAQEGEELGAAVRAAPELMVIKGTVKDPASLNYLRDVVGMLAYLIDAGGTAVLDMQTLRWWSGPEWRAESFEAEFEPSQHVALVGLEEPKGTVWMRTRGMRKFGRPDLSVRGVTEELQQPVVELCTHFIGHQVAGGTIADGEAVKLDGIPAGTTAHHGGSLDDEDFNNVHVEIRLAP